MKYYYKTRPMKHQHRAVKKFVKTGCGALFAEMGTGKTKIGIDWASALSVRDGKPLRALVLCPKSVVSVWPDELEKHDPFLDQPGVGVEWKIVGIDKAWRPLHYEELLLWGPDVIIVDESDMIKTPTANRSKGAYLLSKRCAYRMVMSGTPIGKDILDLFAQYKVVDPGIFGTNYGVFKSEYVLIRAYKVIKYLRLKKLRRVIKPVTFSILKSQCLDLPERRGHAWDEEGGPNIVHVSLSDRSREIYNELAKESIVEFEDIEVMTPIVLTRMLRLSQLASGWLSADGVDRRVGQEKKLQLRNHLEEMHYAGVDKVGVFCRFRHEMRDAANAAKAAGYRTLLLHGGVSDDRRTRARKLFHRTKEPTVFISQWQAGSRGIDLTCASHCICYGLVYSLIQYGQGIDRFHRHGQLNKVTYYHYVATGTLDETVIDSLREKKDISRDIVEDPSLLYGHEGE